MRQRPPHGELVRQAERRRPAGLALLDLYHALRVAGTVGDQLDERLPRDFELRIESAIVPDAGVKDLIELAGVQFGTTKPNPYTLAIGVSAAASSNLVLNLIERGDGVTANGEVDYIPLSPQLPIRLQPQTKYHMNVRLELVRGATPKIKSTTTHYPRSEKW